MHVLFPEGREHCLGGTDVAMVRTALRKRWAVSCPRRLQKCILQAPRNAFCHLLSSSWNCVVSGRAVLRRKF